MSVVNLLYTIFATNTRIDAVNIKCKGIQVQNKAKKIKNIKYIYA